mgnify:CR=1 FL=1
MKKIILVSHGLLAEGMKNSVELISGKNNNLYAFGLTESNSPKAIAEEINKMIEEDVENQYLIISDFPGGSVNTAMISLISKENVYLVSGMNLILCLEIVLASKESKIEDVIEDALDSARKTLLNMKNISKEENEEEDYFND